MVVLRAGELAASGYLVIARHPWASGKLARAAKRLGIHVPSDAVVLRIPPPWAKTRGYLEAASEAQLRAMLEFGRVARETAGMPIEERLKRISEQLKGKSYGGKPMVRRLVLDRIREMLEERAGGAEAAAVEPEV